MNKVKIKWLVWVFAVFLVALVASGCTSGDNNNNQDTNPPANDQNNKEGPKEDITLSIYHEVPEHQQAIFKEGIESQFEHVTLEFVGGDLQELIAEGNIPDMVIRGNANNIPSFLDLDMLMPLDDLIEKHGLDLSMYRDNVIDHYRSWGEEQQLYLLPYNWATWALYYNKDVFDIMNVDYPQNGMTWEEVVDLAADLTKVEDGVQYRGLHPGPLLKTVSQSGFMYVDPETDEPMFSDSDEIRFYVELVEDIINIPGNVPEEDPFGWFQAHQWSGGGEFVSERNVAMHATWNNVGPYSNLEKDDGFNWGMVSWPVWGEGFPDYAPEVEGDSFGISPHSEHPDEAFEIIMYVLSEEFQKYMIEASGKASPLESEVLDDTFMNLAPDRNMEAYILNPPSRSKLDTHSKYEDASYRALDLGVELLFEGEDVISVMNRMQEDAELAIEEAKQTR